MLCAAPYKSMDRVNGPQECVDENSTVRIRLVSREKRGTAVRGGAKDCTRSRGRNAVRNNRGLSVDVGKKGDDDDDDKPGHERSAGTYDAKQHWTDRAGLGSMM